MSIHLLAKLTAKGASLEGLGGGGGITPEDVAGLLAGSDRGPYLALLTKYAADDSARRQLQKLIESLATTGQGRQAPDIRSIGHLVVAQYLAREPISGRKRARYLGIPKTTYFSHWHIRINQLEDTLQQWEAEGFAHLRRKLSLDDASV